MKILLDLGIHYIHYSSGKYKMCAEEQQQRERKYPIQKVICNIITVDPNVLMYLGLKCVSSFVLKFKIMIQSWTTVMDYNDLSTKIIENRN